MLGMKNMKPINSNKNNYFTDRILCDGGCGRYVTEEDWDVVGDGRRLCNECEYRESHDERD